MFYYLIYSALPLLFAPQLDFASVPDPKVRPKFYDFKFEVRLASGKTAEFGFWSMSNDPDATGQYFCDRMARWCGSQLWTFKLDGLKLTLFDVEGDPIVGITVRTTGKEGGNPVLVPGLAYRWVPRVPPKVTSVCLTPRPIGGTRLARAASGAFAATVAAVAAPEIDFAALPDGKERPQAYEVWCLVRLASGKQGREVGEAFVGPVVWLHLHVTRKAGREELRARFTEYIDCWYELRDEAGGTRLALWQYFEAQRDGTAKKDRVVGLTIMSYGPAPAVRWTFRPEFRQRLKRD